MSGRVSFGGSEMDLQDAISMLEEQLATARVAASLPIADQLNQTIRELHAEKSTGPKYDLITSVPGFDGEKPESLMPFFAAIDDIGEMSGWEDENKLKVARLKLSGAAQRFIQTQEPTSIATYTAFKTILKGRFSDKAPVHCYFQQLSMLQQKRGESIEAFADRVRVLNEKTIKTTANHEVNAALREEANRRALDVFLRGLWGAVGEQTRLKFPATLQEAITTAVAIEHLLPSTSGSFKERKVFQVGESRDVTCFNCHERGHISRECPKERTINRQPMTCWYCHKPGHKQSECRRRKYGQGSRPAPMPPGGQTAKAPAKPQGNGQGVNGHATTGPRK